MIIFNLQLLFVGVSGAVKYNIFFSPLSFYGKSVIFVYLHSFHSFVP